MRFAFCLSTKGGSPLQGGLERGLRELGHDVVYYDNGMGKEYDVFVLFNQCAHTSEYAFPEYPNYDIPVVFIDSAEYGYFKRLPHVVQQYANAFSPGSLSHDTKSRHEQEKMMGFLRGKSFPYFIREFSKWVIYPDNYYPIDYPLYHLSLEYTNPSWSNYSKRERDLYVSWGASHPWRNNISDALKTHPCKSEIRVLQDGVVERTQQGEYFKNTFDSKCSVSFDGYGSSSFRKTEVLVRTTLLQGPLLIDMYKPLIDGETCITFDIDSDKEYFLATNVCDKLQTILDDPYKSFQIYAAGYDHCMSYYTERATARYVVDTIEKHDWSKKTEISL